jgi:hypothetical protein
MHQMFVTPLLAIITKYCVHDLRTQTPRNNIIAKAQVVTTRHVYKLWGDIRKVVTVLRP